MPRKHNFPKIKKTLSVAGTILAILGEAGEVTVKSFFPHPYYHTFCNHSRCRRKDKKAFSSNISQLEKRGLIKRKEKEGKNIFYLTDKGEKEAFFAKMNMEKFNSEVISREDWDGKWRIVFFDIPEKLRSYRDYLRRLLKLTGFKEFQKSVWVCPFPIPSFLSEILWEEEIRKYTRFITVTDIDYEDDLKRTFF